MYPRQRSGLRSTIVHDLVPLHFPEWVHPRTRRLNLAKYRHAAETCDLIVTISQFTADDVAEHLGFPRERIVVAYPGIDERFTNVPSNSLLQGSEGYVLMLAPRDPRKNYTNLAAALELLPDLRLVAPDEVSDDELPALYRGAAVLAYPSYFEGFGMPVLEAMASGTPVVASSHPSLDEAAGNAAVRVDPESPESIAEGIERALRERDSLVARGLEHAKGFTWRACGEAHLRGWSSVT
jgi:glycosyltransferase involved in cell wall biosynthesis